MTKSKSVPKLVLSPSRDIPFSQLVLSQKNVRRLKAGLSIEDLAEDIYRRTLLQSLNVRAMLDDDGQADEAGRIDQRDVALEPGADDIVEQRASRGARARARADKRQRLR